jgi:tetratricopeptide (TPR) repeat protein
VRLGSEALPYWTKILTADDFILEKHALRRIREMADPAFAELLEQRLKAEQTPGNRALTQLTLGELLLKKGDSERAEQLLTSVSQEHALYPIALMTLAGHEEKAGNAEAALELIERAMKASPELYVDPDRLRQLRGEEVPVKEPAEAPEADPTLKKAPKED